MSTYQLEIASVFVFSRTTAEDSSNCSSISTSDAVKLQSCSFPGFRFDFHIITYSARIVIIANECYYCKRKLLLQIKFQKWNYETTIKQGKISLSVIILSLSREKSQIVNSKMVLLCITFPHTSLNGNYLKVTVRQMVKHISKLNGI